MGTPWGVARCAWEAASQGQTVDWAQVLELCGHACFEQVCPSVHTLSGTQQKAS